MAFTSLNLTPINQNTWKLAEDAKISVIMPANKGYRFVLKAGFVTNLRSGTDLINPIIPRHGNESRTISYILHDANYTVHYFARDVADDLLKSMLAECDAETRSQIKIEKSLATPDKKYIEFLEAQILGSVKIWAIHKAVRLFGGGAYKEKLQPPYLGNDERFLMEVI